MKTKEIEKFIKNTERLSDNLNSNNQTLNFKKYR